MSTCVLHQNSLKHFKHASLLIQNSPVVHAIIKRSRDNQLFSKTGQDQRTVLYGDVVFAIQQAQLLQFTNSIDMMTNSKITCATDTWQSCQQIKYLLQPTGCMTYMDKKNKGIYVVLNKVCLSRIAKWEHNWHTDKTALSMGNRLEIILFHVDSSGWFLRLLALQKNSSS